MSEKIVVVHRMPDGSLILPVDSIGKIHHFESDVETEREENQNLSIKKIAKMLNEGSLDLKDSHLEELAFYISDAGVKVTVFICDLKHEPRLPEDYRKYPKITKVDTIGKLRSMAYQTGELINHLCRNKIIDFDYPQSA